MTRRTIFAALGSMLASILLVVSACLPGSAAAATATSGAGNGMKVSPVITNLTISPGQTERVQVYVQNVTAAPMTLQALIDDFTANANESGAPALLLNNQYAPSHSLKRFITPINNITLQPGEQKSASVVITVPKNASAGGYYGAIRFAPVVASSESSVTLSASVASLILVKVPGAYKESMKLLSFYVQQGAQGSQGVMFTNNKNLIAVARFQNNGDVQEQPFGKILLQKGSKTATSFEINNTTPAGNVLPSSIRKFTVNLTSVGFIGKYTIIGNFGYGANGQLLSGQTTFYVVPLTAIALGILVILLILFFIFVFPKMVRRYNRRVVQKARRR